MGLESRMSTTRMMRTKTLAGVVVVIAVTFLSVASGEILYAETAPMSFDVWAADLDPGYFLKETTIGDRLCYCKKPGGSTTTAPSSSSGSLGSFNLEVNPVLPTSGVPESSFDYIFITPQGDEENVVVTLNTTSSPACGECDMEVTTDDTNFHEVHEWSSPGWNEGQSYPDGCTCTLKVHVRLSQYGYFVYNFATGSHIKAINNCGYDRMEVNLNGATDKWCDDLSQYSGGEYTVGVPQDYTFVFVSDSGDGNQVAKGFSIVFQTYFFGRRLDVM